MQHKVENHWGIWVDSEKPITGVVSNHTPEFIYDESWDGIDLDYEEYSKEIENDESLSDDEKEAALDQDEANDPTMLIGSWLQDEEGLYYPDETGEYSAIMRWDVTQVVYSKYTKRAALCSPCYPGQADLDTPGDYLAYDLPPEIYGQSEG